jgi:hypothetical protein
MVPILFWLFTQALGFSGALLIVYSVVSTMTQPWPPLERVAEFVSSFLTLLGVLITAASIYIRQEPPHPPWRSSRIVVAPLVIACCVAASIFLIKEGPLPPTLVNGFALLGISGALQRILPTDPIALGGSLSR